MSSHDHSIVGEQNNPDSYNYGGTIERSGGKPFQVSLVESGKLHSRSLKFTELATFIRGTVAHATSITVNRFKLSDSPHRHHLQIYSLLSYDNLCDVCGHPITLCPDDQVWDVVSVSMRDPRVGSVIERSGISNNRRDVYGCFSNFMKDSEHYWYGDILGPVFFYFAGLCHRECKPMRGKVES
jgi:hypothetical protein